MHWQTHGMWNSHLITSSMSQDLLSLIGTYLHTNDYNKSDFSNFLQKAY